MTVNGTTTVIETYTAIHKFEIEISIRDNLYTSSKIRLAK